MKIEEHVRYFELRGKLLKQEINAVEVAGLKALNEKFEREAKNRMEKHVAKVTRVLLKEFLEERA